MAGFVAVPHTPELPFLMYIAVVVCFQLFSQEAAGLLSTGES